MEEIEELRAKAIASMASSANPSFAARRSKSPRSREEGEISPNEEAAELPVSSTAPPKSDATMTKGHLPVVDVDNHVRAEPDCPTVKLPHTSSPSTGEVQIRSSVMSKYSNSSKIVQVPFKSTSNRSLSWHGKGSDDNLVISFSDDDSGSNCEESKPEKSINKKDNNSRGNKSEVPMASAPVPSRVLRGGQKRTKLVLKKGPVYPAPIPSDTRTRLTISKHLAISAEKDVRVPRGNPSTKNSARQQNNAVPHPNEADYRLASLRHEIALRENELKLQSKPMPLRNEKNAGPCNDSHVPHAMLSGTNTTAVRRPASVAGIGLALQEQTMKRLKPAAGSNDEQNSAVQLQLSISSSKSAHQCGLQLPENSDSLHRGDTMDSRNDDNEKQQNGTDLITSGALLKAKDSTIAISSKNENHGKLVTDITHSCDKLIRKMPVDHLIIDGQRTFLPPLDPNIEEGTFSESTVSRLKNLGQERSSLPDVSRGIDASSMLPNRGPGEHSILRTQEIVATTGAQMPQETASHFTERHAGQALGSKSDNDENMGLNYSSWLPGEHNMNLQSLMALEDLQDRELQEAQELRQRCELEERRALKAYREAQKALIDANEKCSLLYRKRELFSAQLRALLLQASSSMWPSSCHGHGGTVSKSTESVPDANFGLSSLGDQLPVECRNLGQLGLESNAGRSDDVQPDVPCQQLKEHDFASGGPCLEQDASTSDQRENSALDVTSTPIHHRNMSTDDEENFSLDHRPVEFKSTCNIMAESHGRTTDLNESEGLTSDENAQDHELLEASLRLKLVERLGSRTSYKSNKMGKAECPARGGADDQNGANTGSPLAEQQRMEGQQIELLELDGVERLGRSASLHSTDNQSYNKGFSLTDEAYKNSDPPCDTLFHVESCMPNETTGSVLPPPVLHVASGHVKCTLLGLLGESSTAWEKEVTMHKELTQCIPDGEISLLYSMEFARIGEMELHNYDLAVDPFWPFCMFELRGRCNNEECQMQHVKDLKRNQHSATSSSDSVGIHLLSVGKYDYASGPPYGIFHRSLSIPPYHIGANPIKVEPYLSHFALARSLWQYWQRGFCASFSLPFSVRRILPPEAPFLQGDDGPVADDYSWNRLSLYYQTLDCSMNQSVHGLPESELSLEMALDLFDGSICKPDRKKALCMLSRAIEADPSSVSLWVVYLHIYYAREKNIGKDDMFFHAVQQDKGSYEFWIMYINSRMQLDDRLNAYEYALTEFCHNEKAFERDRSYASACILDIFLQMIDFFCMSGNVEKAIQKIIGLVGNSDDTLLLDIQSCLVVSDRCIFWFCCIYLAIYRKLPELIIQQLELEKELTFGIEWPTNHLRTDIRERVLDLVKLAVDKVALDIVTNPLRKDEVALRSLHFLSVTHVKCVAALEGLQRSTDLLTTYLSLYPTCIQLILMSARLKENSTGGVVLEGFEELLSNLAKGISGNQCLWNQYVEHALAEKRVNLAESILARWSERFCEDTTLNERNFNGRKDIFWFLNLSLYRMTQKNLKEAQSAIDNALKLASPQDFKHIVREHVAFTFAIEVDFKRNKPFGVILNLLNVYLADSRSTTILELLSRKFYRCIKRPRARQLLSNMLGPVSRDFTLLNSVLEACYGTSLLPEKVDDPKEFVDFIEALMEITPANYKLALSVYKSTTTFCHPSVATNAIKFWACSLLINSIFQAVPVPPENIWVDAANAMRNSEILDISVRFHQQALSVYPFSIKLWQFYLDLCRNTEDLDVIIEAAKERGVELR